MNVREAAYLSLLRCKEGAKYTNLELDAAIRKYGFTGQDRGFFTRLIYGVTEREISLDWFIGCFSSVKPDKLEPEVLILLRLGLYQILYLDRTPDSAAVNETVEIAKQRLHRGISGYVNAVLRTAVRQKGALPLPQTGTLARLSVEYSCSLWLCRLFVESYGRERAEAILASTLSHPKLTLRVNTLKITRDALLKRLISGGYAAEKTARSPFGIRLSGNVPVTELSVLSEGLCFVQDEASQLCAAVLGAMPGESVLDTCACPGGKSFSAAMLMENQGSVLSLDLHESKLSLVRSGAERLGITSLSCREQNGTVREPSLVGMFDRVLCDVPCSGLGVIAKKPDLRRKTPEEIARLPQIQAKILAQGAEYVKPGGTLLYSTCTLNPAENERNAEAFLSSHPDFVPTGELMPQNQPFCTLFPDEYGTDGFFLAKFLRK